MLLKKGLGRSKIKSFFLKFLVFLFFIQKDGKNVVLSGVEIIGFLKSRNFFNNQKKRTKISLLSVYTSCFFIIFP